MNFKNISIIFAFFTLKVLSSPIKDSTADFTLLNKNAKVSNYAVNDSIVEVEIPIDELDRANVADLYFEVVTDAEVETDSESETDSEGEMVSDIISEYECSTPECFEASKRIISMMDTTVDPCEDFYQFSCGGWISKTEIPKTEYGINTTIELENKNREIIHQILEGEYPMDKNLSPEDQELDKEIFDKVKTIYNTCMDEEAIRKQGKEPLINLLNQLDLYSIKWKYKRDEGITKLIVDLHQYGIHFLFSSQVSGNIINHSNNIIFFNKPELVLLLDHYKNKMILYQYKSVIMETLNRLFENQENGRNIEEMADKIIIFEVKLSDIFKSSPFLITTVGDLVKDFPNINWKSYIDKRYKNYNIKTSFNDKSVVVDVTPKYFEGLNILLKETDIDTLVYYAEWNVITNYIQYISDDFSKPYIDFINSLLYGITEKGERYKTCTKSTEEMMGIVLSKYFVEKVYDINSKEMITDIIDNIKQAMFNRISEMKWVDQSTPNHIKKKVKEMDFKNIGYPDYIFKPKKLLKEYEGFEIDSDVFFNTVVNYGLFTERKNYKKIDEDVVFNEWKKIPQNANPSYYAHNNSITVPAGILQSPFFNTQQPDYLNYGAIGNALGHEIIHAFDSNGSLFDYRGEYVNWEHWLTNYYSYLFNTLPWCFINQYSDYSYKINDINWINLDGFQTFNENLADNGGLSRAFEAWKLSNKDDEKFNERNKALPGLSEFTAEQLFYIAFGQSFCEKGTPEMAKTYLSSNLHSLGQYRIIGSISNNEQFAKVFSCPKNSPMNPELKCKIW